MMFILDDSGYKEHKYAIFLLCYGNDYYLMGLLCTLFAHQTIIKESKMDIELVVMCDEYINKYRDYFKMYCDRIVVMNMDVLREHHKLYRNAKYSKKWMNYIINKWHCLYFEEYSKILFTDIDILPTQPSNYNVFTDYSEPYIFCGRKFDGRCIIHIFHNTHTKGIYKDYYNYIEKGDFFIDAGYILLTPSKKLHDEYFDFVKTIDTTNKNALRQESGIDEVTLYYFIAVVKDLKYNCIKKEHFPVVPWKSSYMCAPNDVINKNIKNGKIFNYLSTVKPFVKPVSLMWPEEYIWKILENKVVKNNTMAKSLSVRNSLHSYLYLEKKDDSLQIINKSKKHDIYNLIGKLKSKKLNLGHPLFSERAFETISRSTPELNSYVEPLNKIDDNIDIIKKCCGLITVDHFSLFT